MTLIGTNVDGSFKYHLCQFIANELKPKENEDVLILTQFIRNLLNLCDHLEDIEYIFPESLLNKFSSGLPDKIRFLAKPKYVQDEQLNQLYKDNPKGKFLWDKQISIYLLRNN